MVNPVFYALYQSQKDFFHSGKTREIGFRIDALKKIRKAISAHEKDICAAVFADLHKEETKAYAMANTALIPSPTPKAFYAATILPMRRISLRRAGRKFMKFILKLTR